MPQQIGRFQVSPSFVQRLQRRGLLRRWIKLRLMMPQAGLLTVGDSTEIGCSQSPALFTLARRLGFDSIATAKRRLANQFEQVFLSAQ